MFSKRFTRLYKIFTGTCAEGGEELLLLEGRLERALHFCVLVWRHFVRNRCLVRASSLAYTTLLALIPLLAVVISVSSTVLQNKDEDQIYQYIASIAPPAVDTRTNSPHFHSSSKWSTATASAITNQPAANIYTDAQTNDETNFIVKIPSGSGTNVIVSPVGMDTNAVATDADSGVINDQKEVARWLRQFVQNTQGATLGVTGLFFFALIAIMMLGRIEDTFNDIWGVTRGRNWPTRIMLYWGAITLGPTMVLGAISLSSGSHMAAVKHYFEFIPLGDTLLQLLPLALLWVTFTIIYVIVPNTRVNLSAAAIGGLVAGIAWHLINVSGIFYVSRVVMSKHIYGSIGLIPVFMIGLYFLWVILLFGSQVAYSYQNRAAYLQDKIADNVNQRGREFVALRIMTLLGQRFQHGQRPASVLQLSTDLGVPSRLTQQVLRILGNAHLVIEVGRPENAYVPARPLDTINVHHILLALRAGSGQELPLQEAAALSDVYGEFARIEEAERNASEKISLLALVQRMPTVTALNAPAEDQPKGGFLQIPQIETIHLPIGRDEDEVDSAPDPFIGTEAEKAMATNATTTATATSVPVVREETVAPVAAEIPEAHTAVATLPEPDKKVVRRETIQPEERDFPL